MDKKLENLRQKLINMEIVTVGAATEYTGLSRETIIHFVKETASLRIFDEKNQLWINENVDGHC